VDGKDWCDFLRRLLFRVSFHASVGALGLGSAFKVWLAKKRSMLGSCGLWEYWEVMMDCVKIPVVWSENYDMQCYWQYGDCSSRLLRSRSFEILNANPIQFPRKHHTTSRPSSNLDDLDVSDL